MTHSTTPGAIKKFRRTPWKYQHTFHTPLRNLEKFVSVILSAHGYPESGCVTIDDVISEPRTLNGLLAEHSISTKLSRDSSLEAAGGVEVERLLRATLADWIDFLFIPQPRPFVIYADHDEFTTFYANSRGSLSKIALALSDGGFRSIDNYERTFK